MPSASRPNIISCPGCFYDLTNLPAEVARCPECGTSTTGARSPLRLRNHRPWQTNIVALGALLIGLGTLLLAYGFLRECGVRLPTPWPSPWVWSPKDSIPLELVYFLEPGLTVPALLMCLGAALMTVRLPLPSDSPRIRNAASAHAEGRGFTIARWFCRLALVAPLALMAWWYGQHALQSDQFAAGPDGLQVVVQTPPQWYFYTPYGPAGREPPSFWFITAVSIGLLAPWALLLLLDRRLDKPFRGWHAARRLALLSLPIAAVVLFGQIRWMISERLDRTSVPPVHYYGAVSAAVIFYGAAFTNLAVSYLGLAWSLWRVRPRPAQTASVPAQTATTPAHIPVPPPSDS